MTRSGRVRLGDDPGRVGSGFGFITKPAGRVQVDLNLFTALVPVPVVDASVNKTPENLLQHRICPLHLSVRQSIQTDHKRIFWFHLPGEIGADPVGRLDLDVGHIVGDSKVN